MWIVNLLELCTCNHLVCLLLEVSKPVGDPVFNDVGPRVDIQLRLSVLLPVLRAYTLWSFSTVSTSMVSERLTDGADVGGFVLKLVVDLGFEGPGVGGKSGLGVQLRLNSLGSLGTRVSLHVSVVLEEVDSWR